MKILKNTFLFAFILLLLVFSLRFLVFKTYIISQKTALQKEALSNSCMEVKQLTVLESELNGNSGKYEWKENGKELVINGIIHEVISITKQGNSLKINLVEDKKENNLMATFFRLNSSNHSAFTDIVKLLLCLTFIVPMSFLLTGPYRVLPVLKVSLWHNYPTKLAAEPVIPPEN